MSDEMKGLQLQIHETAACVSSMKTQLTVMANTANKTETAVTILLERSDHAKENCPMRVDIARAGNGATEARREANDAHAMALVAVNSAHKNEVNLAKLGIAAGGGGAVGGTIFAIIAYLLKTI